MDENIRNALALGKLRRLSNSQIELNRAYRSEHGKKQQHMADFFSQHTLSINRNSEALLRQDYLR